MSADPIRAVLYLDGEVNSPCTQDLDRANDTGEEPSGQLLIIYQASIAESLSLAHGYH